MADLAEFDEFDDPGDHEDFAEEHELPRTPMLEHLERGVRPGDF